jgi:hypothetical protein
MTQIGSGVEHELVSAGGELDPHGHGSCPGLGAPVKKWSWDWTLACPPDGPEMPFWQNSLSGP